METVPSYGGQAHLRSIDDRGAGRRRSRGGVDSDTPGHARGSGGRAPNRKVRV